MSYPMFDDDIPLMPVGPFGPYRSHESFNPPTPLPRISIVTLSDFLNGFAAEWYAASDAGELPSGGPYGNRDVWKQFVEGESGLVARVLRRIQGNHPALRYCREAVFRFDGAYAIGNVEPYPVTFAAFVEHELNDNPEREMQKLILARALLKVLIFYDYGEHQKTTVWRQQWVESKLAWFASALARADTLCPENPSTAYLFIVGKHPASAGAVEWFHASNISLQLTRLERRG
jgi:hypothetical protein